jgi:hypothetical protein
MPDTILVNAHIHTPYSFSSFASIDDAVARARKGNIGVLGISDFNTIDGYAEFGTQCERANIYPLYNIEFIVLMAEDRDAGVRWNDPANPGVMYFCGKALDHPTTLSADSKNRLLSLWKGTQDQIQEVIQKLNEHLAATATPVKLDYQAMRAKYAKKTVRERHVARALADELRARFPDKDACLAAIRKACANASLTVDVDDSASLQNELRNQLLKAGKPAFVQEKPSAFLPLDTVKNIILDGGGIPCYPVLVDDSRPFNEREADPNTLAKTLTSAGICAVEFIPSRNSMEVLKRYVTVFRENGFSVTFGTEHNTPDLGPLLPHCRKGVAFDQELLDISYDGACVLAAHQEARRQRQPGFVDRTGRRLVSSADRKGFSKLGDAAIRKAIGGRETR